MHGDSSIVGGMEFVSIEVAFYGMLISGRHHE